MTRTVALWLTSITWPLSCRSRTRVMTGSARAAMSYAVSPPGGDTSAGSSCQAANAAGSFARTSALLEALPPPVGDLAQTVSRRLARGRSRARWVRRSDERGASGCSRARSIRARRPPAPLLRLQSTVVGERRIQVAAEDAFGGLRRIPVADQMNREHAAMVSGPNACVSICGGRAPTHPPARRRAGPRTRARPDRRRSRDRRRGAPGRAGGPPPPPGAPGRRRLRVASRSRTGAKASRPALRSLAPRGSGSNRSKSVAGTRCLATGLAPARARTTSRRA